MYEMERRSLKKDASRLKDEEKRFLSKHTCRMEGCGADFVFTIARGAYEQENVRLKKYEGSCGKCGQRILLSQNGYNTWKRLISGSELKITDTTYSNLFDDS